MDAIDNFVFEPVPEVIKALNKETFETRAQEDNKKLREQIGKLVQENMGL